MFSHKQIWTAIDRLADYNNLSPSGLARRAGLDPTTFNKSKRFAKDGRPRWPSTESLAKILSVTNTSLDTFYRFITPRPSESLMQVRPRQTVPLLGFAQAGAGGFFDDGGYPVGQGWQEVELPNVADDDSYALRITGDSMLPIYRDGDIIVVSTTQNPLPGDRVVVKTGDGEVMAKVLLAMDVSAVNLMSFNVEHPARKVDLKDIEWIARITWASQ